MTQVTDTPTSKDDCKDGGWRRFNSPTNERFNNQGHCVSFVKAAERHRL